MEQKTQNQLKASDFRVGNWVRLYLNHSDFTEFQIELPDLNLIENDKSRNYQPIPLTEAWHNKFGVELNGFKQFVYILPRNRNIDVKVVFDRDYVFIRQGSGGVTDDVFAVWNNDVTKRDMYVHEWQNLYHALTGEELTYGK
jgi:hypothetical protein